MTNMSLLKIYTRVDRDTLFFSKLINGLVYIEIHSIFSIFYLLHWITIPTHVQAKNIG